LNQQKLLDDNRKRFVQLVSFSIVLLLTLLLLRSFIRTIDQAEQQLVEEYQQIWVSRLAQVHGLWLARFRPTQLTVNFWQESERSEGTGSIHSITLQMNQAGWPKVNSSQDCLLLWRDMMGLDWQQQPSAALVEYTQQECQFTFKHSLALVYRAQQGQVLLQVQ
jgi:hypothetical protein